MMRNNWILIGVAVASLVLVSGCLSSNNEYEDVSRKWDSYNVQNNEYNTASQRWDSYKAMLNSDINELNKIAKSYQNTDTVKEFQEFIDQYVPRLEMLEKHLVEARTFLNTKGHLISNQIELQKNIDDTMVWVASQKNKINTAIDEYNRAVQSQQQKQEAIYNLLKVVSGISLF